jgi:23S rRNA pseudouridine2605 synthase
MNKKDNSGKRPRIIKVTKKKPTEKRSEAIGEDRPVRKSVRGPKPDGTPTKTRASYQKNEAGEYTKKTNDQSGRRYNSAEKTENSGKTSRNTPVKRFRTQEGESSGRDIPEKTRESSRGRFEDKSRPKTKKYPGKPKFRDEADPSEKKSVRPSFGKYKTTSKSGGRGSEEIKLIRLNKYLADAGICSRREADDLIKAGVVSVNGRIVSEVGTKVKPEDKVVYGGQTLSREKPRYVLLNKPKGFITTSDDPFERKTVMELVKNACDERIYPVGRLDRNTLGLLLFTNDGELAKKLMHPRHGVKKLYHVELDKPLTKNDLLKIASSIELEDGLAEVDKISWVNTDESKKEVGIEIHSGKNRIVRRIFETLDYKVIKLDRVTFAGLTKLNLPRGRWRHLTPKEIGMLKSIK